MPLEAYYTHLSPTIFLRGGREMRESPGKRNRDFQPWSSEKIAVSGLFVLSEASSLRPNLTALAELFGFTNGSCQEVIWSTRTPHAEEPAGASHTPSANDAFLIRKWESAPPGNGGTGTSTFVSRGGEPMGAQKKNNNFTATGKQAYRALRRRGVAALLTLSMLLPIVPTSLAAGTGLLRPIQATPVDIDQDVQVEVEGNMVRDPYNRKILTGYYELGLRVKTPAGKSFRTLSMTLEYDSAHFTPVDWSDNDTPVDMTTNIIKHYQKDMRAWSIGGVNDLDAFGGTPAVPDAPIDDPTAPTPAVDPNRAMMTFTVRANKAAELKFDDMTTIAVVRFKVHDDPNFVPTVPGETEDFLSHFSLKKNGPGDFSLCYDDDLTDTTAPTVVDTMEVLRGKMGTNAKPLANAATDDDVDGSASDVNMSFDYMLWDDADETKSYEYYYVPGYKYDDTDPTTYDQVTTTINGQSYTLNRPKLKGDAILAVDPNKPDGDPDKYSYVSNLVTNDPVLQGGNPTGWYENINFTLVSKPSAIPGMDQAAQMATIVYLDWDNTIIGEQSAPADGKSILDVVNDYAATYLIYHDTDLVNYGSNDLNDPNDPANTDSPLDIVKSLDRKYNYRGKYPTSPSPDNTTNGTTVDDKTALDPISGERILPLGKTYPLTNKLDYVFFKRPMERKSTLTRKPLPTDAAYQSPDSNNKTGAQHSQYIADLADWNTWEQKADTSGANPVAEYDTENPFAYGWALCTRSNYQNVWTTLGTAGELSYNGAATGGYNELNGAPGEITFTAGDQSADFIIADLEDGITGPIYLKAIYEPGTELMIRSFSYRMIKEPYYNKMNTGAANAGGAYSADMTFERATTDMKAGDTENLVRGVARMRDPYVRQDVTNDLMWEENTALGVNHNLPNENMDSAYRDKYKTTYIKVETTNTEEVPVSLTLSARQNKVDYYLNEAYGTNFVSGGARSDNDRTRSEKMAVADNYNYYVQGESNETDTWYDAPYNDREGSRGFVLMGTLNQIMEKATECYNGEMTVIELMNTYATVDNLMDINVRKSDGTYPGLVDTQAFVQKIVDAAGAAQTAHVGGNNAYWNTERNCAQLTYHQLQGYVINGSLNHPETPISGVSWCHLHKACADANSSKPQNWKDLLEAADDGTMDPSDYILSELEGIAHLRKADGSKYATPAEYISALETFVAIVPNGTSASWDEFQAAIMNNGDTAADGPNKYWWYDGADSVPLTNWGELLAAAKDAYIKDATLAPGETNATAVLRPAKLNQLETAFNDNASATSPDADWVAGTDNLCADNNGGKFASFDDFKTELTGALEAANNAGVTAPTWHQIQYHIIHKNDAGYAFPEPVSTSQQTEMDGYWWYKGGEQVVDLPTLLKAADQANNGNPASLNAVTTTLLNDTVYLRKDEKGTKFATADPDMTTELTALKTALKTLVAANGTSLTWEQVQYYIARGQLDDKTLVVDPEAAYYWWKGGGQGTVITFTQVTDPTSAMAAFEISVNITSMINAVFRAENYGDPKALDNLSAADIFKCLRLVESIQTNPPVELTDLNEYTTISAFSTKMLAIINAARADEGITDTFTQPNQISWARLQDYYLCGGGTYRDDTTIANDANADYWWYSKNSNSSTSASDHTAPLSAALEQYAQDSDATELKKAITRTLLNASPESGGYAIKKTSSGGTWGAAAASNQTKAKNIFKALGDAIIATGAPYYDSATGKVSLTWAQIQYFFLFSPTGIEPDGTSGLVDNNTAIHKLADPAPAGLNWAALGHIPSGIVVPTSLEFAPVRKQMALRPQVTTEVSPDGLTETTTSTMRTWNEDTQSMDVEIMTVVVTKIVGETTTTIVTTTTITITTLDPETLQPVTAVDTDTEVETVPNTSSTYTPEDDTTLTDPDEEEDGTDSTYSNKEDTTLTDPDKKDPDKKDPDNANNSFTYSTDDDTTLTDPDNVDDVDNITDSNNSGSNTGNDNNFTYSNKDDTTITGSDDDGDDGTSDNTNTSGNTTRPAEGVGPYDKTDTNNSTYTNSGSSTAGADSSTMGPDDPVVPSTDLTDSNGAPGGPSTTDSTYTTSPDTTPLTTTYATPKSENPIANDLKISYNKEENTHTPTATTAAGLSGSGKGALGDVAPEGGESVKSENWEKGLSLLTRTLSENQLTAETGGQSIAQASWQELLSARRIPQTLPEKASPGVSTFVFLDSGQRWGPPPDPGGGPLSLPLSRNLVAYGSVNTAPIRRITHE